MTAWTVAATSGVYGSPRLYCQFKSRNERIDLLDDLHWQRVSREEQNDLISFLHWVLFQCLLDVVRDGLQVS
jgi:hypothetical protein